MENNWKCNICYEKIENRNDLVRLKCDPERHYFCHICIKDWYIQNLFDYNTLPQYGDTNDDRNIKLRSCPICRLDGGYLLFRDEYNNFNNKIFKRKMRVIYTVDEKKERRKILAKNRAIKKKEERNKL